MEKKSARINNIDSTLITEQPKILPHVEAMKISLAAALGLDADQVGVKATTNELMGCIGRGEGIAAMAVASVEVGE